MADQVQNPGLDDFVPPLPSDEPLLPNLNPNLQQPAANVAPGNAARPPRIRISNATMAMLKQLPNPGPWSGEKGEDDVHVSCEELLDIFQL